MLVEWQVGGHSVVATKLADGNDFAVGADTVCMLTEGKFAATILAVGMCGVQ